MSDHKPPVNICHGIDLMQGDLTHLGNAVERMVGEKQHLALPMIVVLEQHNAHQYQHLIDEMFRLRARIFRYRLNWDVEVTDGKERDRYDNSQRRWS